MHTARGVWMRTASAFTPHIYTIPRSSGMYSRWTVAYSVYIDIGLYVYMCIANVCLILIAGNYRASSASHLHLSLLLLALKCLCTQMVVDDDSSTAHSSVAPYHVVRCMLHSKTVRYSACVQQRIRCGPRIAYISDLAYEYSVSWFCSLLSQCPAVVS